MYFSMCVEYTSVALFTHEIGHYITLLYAFGWSFTSDVRCLFYIYISFACCAVKFLQVSFACCAVKFLQVSFACCAVKFLQVSFACCAVKFLQVSFVCLVGLFHRSLLCVLLGSYAGLFAYAIL